MYYIVCCNWLVAALLCMAGSIDALACSSLIQCINCNLYQQTCKHTGLKLVSSCDCFPFWSWDTTLFHSCLYSALIRLGCFLLLQLFLQLRVTCSFQIVFYWSFGHILVTCILILHFLWEHLYPGTQLVNHLPQLTDSLIIIN